MGQTELPVTFDLGLLLVSNPNAVDANAMSDDQRERYLTALGRQNAQLLVHELWQLPTERAEDAVVALLPPRRTPLPREKPPPKPKASTRWEEYAKLKGIQKRKKERAVWDAESNEWRPAWGYRRANDATKSWLLEVPDSADPNEDQFQRLKREKRERVAKNELQRLRNIGRGVKSVGVLPGQANSSKEFKKAIVVAKRSDASVGQFSKKVEGEKVGHLQGKRRNFLSNTGTSSAERQMQQQVMKELATRAEPLNAERLANKALQRQQRDAASAEEADGGRRRRGGTVGKVGESGKSRRQNKRDTKSRKYKKKQAGQSRAAGKAAKAAAGKGRTLGKRK